MSNSGVTWQISTVLVSTVILEGVSCVATGPCFVVGSKGTPYRHDLGGVVLAMSTSSRAPTTTTPSVTPMTTTAGETATYSVVVTGTGAAPTGAVTFKVGSTSLCRAALIAGSGTCHSTAAPVGTDTVTATYSGDTTYAGSTGTVKVAVKGPPRFTADSPPTTAVVGRSYTYAFSAAGYPAPTYSLSGEPTWLSINTSTGVVSGTPPSGTTTFSYSVKATNGVSPGASVGPFTVSVYTIIVVSTVDGSQAYGSSSPNFSGSYTRPTAATVTGTLTCTEVTSGTRAISSTLAAGTYTVKATTCSGLVSTTGDYTFTYAAKATGFSVAKATPTTPTISNLPASGTGGGGFTATVSTNGDGNKYGHLQLDKCLHGHRPGSQLRRRGHLLALCPRRRRDRLHHSQGTAQTITVSAAPPLKTRATTWWAPTAGSSSSRAGQPPAASSARCPVCASTSTTSWAWCPPPTTRATSWSGPTAGSSPSATPRSWARCPGSG